MQQTNFTKPYNIVLLGDSITQYGDKNDGWVGLLRDHYQGKCLFSNLGISGLNTSQYLQLMQSQQFDQMMPKYVDKIIISFGANDSAYGLEANSEFHQGVEISQYSSNLEKMIDICKVYTQNIALMTPPPLKQYQRRTTEQTEKYTIQMREVGKKVGVQVLDMRHNITENVEYHIDGIHMNDNGNNFIFQCVKQHIGEVPFWRAHWSKWVD